MLSLRGHRLEQGSHCWHILQPLNYNAFAWRYLASQAKRLGARNCVLTTDFEHMTHMTHMTHYDMTYLNIQDLSGKCNQRHVNLSIYLADSTRHTFGKPWKRSCRLILLTKSSGFFLSMSRPRWVLKSNGIWKALFVSAGDRGRSTHYLSISLLRHGNPWI